MTVKKRFTIILVSIATIGILVFAFITFEAKPKENLDLTATTTVFVYFFNNNLDPEISCNKVFPAQRIVTKPAFPEETLERLLEGPSQTEKADGYYSIINPGVKINSIIITEGIARADFSQELESQGGSCRASGIRAEITRTLEQFPTVKTVIISINGNSEEILQP